jgi:acetoin utilization deacetylase AcuC-like enzyme
MYAVDQVISGRNRNGFCVVRPPGHSAGIYGMKNPAAGCGLCLFNNVAIAAMHALDHCDRVAIINIDAHHGDGTEDIVRLVRAFIASPAVSGGTHGFSVLSQVIP